MNKHQIELNDKELYLLWTIACYFNEPVTATLKQKLYPGQHLRRKFDPKYEKALEDRLIDFGTWLKEYREKEANDAR